MRALTNAIVPLVLFAAVTFGLMKIVAALSRWLADRRDPIDKLIAKNRARPRDGMETTDWRLVARAGDRRWLETLKAQARYVRRPLIANPIDDEDDDVTPRRTPIDDEEPTWQAGPRTIN